MNSDASMVKRPPNIGEYFRSRKTKSQVASGYGQLVGYAKSPSVAPERGNGTMNLCDVKSRLAISWVAPQWRAQMSVQEPWRRMAMLELCQQIPVLSRYKRQTNLKNNLGQHLHHNVGDQKES